MRVAAYLRVSTSEQTVDNQLPAVMQYCQAHNWPEPEIFSENESAWKVGHQHELKRLLDDLRGGKRKFDVLIVWALDRLSRQGAASILNLVNSLKSYGCRVISLQESWTELPGELGEVLFAIAGWAARLESQRRSERTKAGLARAKANGTLPVRGKDKGRRRTAGYLARYQKKVRLSLLMELT